MTKIIITVEQGIVTQVGANNTDVEIVILDFDEQGDEPLIISNPAKPDYTFADGEAHKLWNNDKEAKRFLKKYKF